ncbi:WhiB family transcriptional regulator [Streptomyces sp. NPDC006510]|uniref:WhiB family transcriptional regulator n=1 Tax=Streptomyces sp. NPDC006510 TaxID=3155600 RepID=UPI0033B9E1C9
MTLTRFSPTAARLARRAVLQAAVDTSARCGDQRYRDLFDRNPLSSPATWSVQQAAARQICTGCPVRAACEELALRDGIGDRSSSNLVRGGRTGQELAIIREIRQPGRLAAAAAADWQHLLALTAAARADQARDRTIDTTWSTAA